jgi:hypothetical protein
VVDFQTVQSAISYELSCVTDHTVQHNHLDPFYIERSDVALSGKSYRVL